MVFPLPSPFPPSLPILPSLPFLPFLPLSPPLPSRREAAPYNQLGVWGSAVSSPSDRFRAEPGRQTVFLHLWS
jgi:hypothetical protein